MRDISNMSRGYAMAKKTGAAHYHAKLAFPDKGSALKGLLYAIIGI